LIVEFAKAQVSGGAEIRDAILHACELRLRPILMTSFAFILGVLPLLACQRSRSGNAASPGNRRFQRHARGDSIWNISHASILLRHLKISEVEDLFHRLDLRLARVLAQTGSMRISGVDRAKLLDPAGGKDLPTSADFSMT